MLALPDPGNTTQAGLLSAGFDLTSFIEVFQAMPFHLYIRNSLIIATGVTAFMLVFASLAGHTFGRAEFRGKRPLFLVLISVSYFPGATFIVGPFKLLAGNVTVLGVTSPNLLVVGFVGSLNMRFVNGRIEGGSFVDAEFDLGVDVSASAAVDDDRPANQTYQLLMAVEPTPTSNRATPSR